MLFGLGYAHAQDRLWQMTMLRRTAQGRLSELFGRETVQTDELMRRLGLYRAATASVAAQDAETLAKLEAYAAWRERADHGGQPRGVGAGRAGVLPVRRRHRAVAASRLDRDRQAACAAAVGAGRRGGPPRARLARPAARAPARPAPGRAEPRDGGDRGAVPDARPLRARGGRPIRSSGPWPSPRWRARRTPSRSRPRAPPRARRSWPTIRIWASPRRRRGTSPGSSSRPAARSAGRSPACRSCSSGARARLGWGLTSAYLDDQDVLIEELAEGDPTLYRTPDGWESFETRALDPAGEGRGADHADAAVDGERPGPDRRPVRPRHRHPRGPRRGAVVDRAVDAGHLDPRGVRADGRRRRRGRARRGRALPRARAEPHADRRRPHRHDRHGPAARPPPRPPVAGPHPRPRLDRGEPLARAASRRRQPVLDRPRGRDAGQHQQPDGRRALPRPPEPLLGRQPARAADGGAYWRRATCTPARA